MNALDLPASCSTLVDLLRFRATEQPDRLAYNFLLDGETQEATLTYAQLDRRARAIGATLESRGARGARVLLLFPPGLEYAAAVLGCLYAGAVAVPAYPPDPARLGRTLPRLQALIADAQASFALTLEAILPMVSALAEQSEALKSLRWLATDGVEDGAADAWRDPAATGDTLAILQYTSGSTAAPRGVMLTHGNLLHNSAAIHRCFEHSTESRGVIWLPPYHDMGLIGGVLQPLCGGFPVVLMSPLDFLRRPLRWLQAISRYRATTSGGPNFAYDLCVRKVTEEQIAALDLSSWDLAFNGAEPIRAETLDRFAETFAPCGFRREAFYPCYGLAEATLIVSGGRKERPPTVRAFDRGALQRSRAVEEPAGEGGGARRLVGCGASIPGHEVLVVDPESMTAAPAGQLGEIWVSGVSVAQGYWNRQEETTATFGARLRGREGTFLRTGDIGFLQGGELFVTGRSKDLIILRGRNHYPQDIELTVERCHPAVRQGCSAAFSVEAPAEERAAAEERLVVVAEIDASRAPDAQAIAAAVRGAVAEQHELQAHAVVLLRPGSIPKTSSGKIQRRACRAGFLSGELEALHVDVLPEAVHDEAEAGQEAPARDRLLSAAPEERRLLLEDYLSAQVARVIGIAPALIDRRRSLGALGLDSIQSIELRNRVEADLGLTVASAGFLAAPGVADLAAQLALEIERPPGAPPAPIQPAPRDGRAPLSSAQERFWFLDRLIPGSCAHVLLVAARLDGPLDVTALAQGLDAIVRRHEGLRTTFPAVDGAPVQVVSGAPPGGKAVLDPSADLVDLGGLPAGERDAAWRRLARLEAQRPFDLAEGPLLRVRLIRLSDREHVLVLAIHHIVADGWSLGIFVRELAALYEGARAGRLPRLPDLPIQVADFAVWQRRREQALEADLAYWKRQLGGSLPVLDLPSDRPRPPARTTEGATRCLALPGDLSDALRALCRREGVTLFMLLLAAYSALLHRYTGQEDIVVGSPVAGRDRAETEGLIGCFINLLALRVDLSGAPTFLELLGRVREVTLGAYAHQELPFERLVEALRPDRDPSRTPIFQAVLILQNTPMPALSLGDVKLTPVVTETGGAAFDVTMTVTDRPEGIQIALEYSADLFDAATVDRMLGHTRALLGGVAADPAQRLAELPLLGEEERQTVCVAWNRTDRRFELGEAACVHHLVEATARRRPRAVAAVCGEERIDHGELERRSRQLANHLIRRGVGPGALVGICVDRSLDMVVGLLGILQAGAAYVPLDPAYPRERLSFIMEDAELQALVTTRQLAAALPDGGVPRVWLDADRAEIDRESAAPPAVAVDGGSLAYVIYTSGSTGKPKGVEITHGAVVNLLASMRERPGLGERDRLLAVTSLSFDIAALEIFLPLATGALLDVARRELSTDGAALARHLDRERVTVLQATPATFRLLLEAGWEGSADLKILVGGEALPRELADALVDRAASVWNMYGPTETTIWSCVHPVEKGEGPVPIGRPIANTRVHVLSDRLQPLPVGIPGELYIGGAGLARGYHRRPDLTAERFVRDPFAAGPDARLYRTGDRVRWRPDGSLEFLGRLDHQVKIRGFRIELGEIEAALGAHPGVGQAVVVAREIARGDRALVAYLTAGDGPPPAPGELRAYLQEKLPEYMIPAAFVALEAMPLTPNGKVDRNALPAPSQERPEAGSAHAAPTTEAEAALAEVWAEVLGHDRVGVDDNFFELGGDSIRSVQVLSRARRRGLSLSVQQLFKHQTIRELSRVIATEPRPEAPAADTRPFELISAADRARIPEGVEDAYPLSALQAGMIFHSESSAGSAVYNDVFSFHLEAELDVPSLRRALDALSARHPALRTSFDLARFTEPLQLVHRAASPALAVEDLRGLDADAQRAAIAAWIEEEKRRGFAWSSAPLVRLHVHLRSAASFQLTVSFHHAILDGWSVASLLTELFQEMAAARRGEAPPPAGGGHDAHRRFVALEREAMASEAARRFWAQQLDGAAAARLPRLGGADGRGPSAGPRVAHVRIAPGVAQGLRALAGRCGAPLKSVLLAAHLRVIHLVSGQTDATTGVITHGRPEVPGAERALGLYLNTLPLRHRLRPGSWSDLVREAFDLEREMLPHQRYPLAEIQRLHGGAPFETTFNFVHFHVYRGLGASSGVRFVDGTFFEQTNIALAATFLLDPASSDVELRLAVNDPGIGDLQIQRIARHYEAALSAMAREPGARADARALLSDDELRRALATESHRAAELPAAQVVHRLFEAQVERTPDATAVVLGDESLSFAALNARANQLAHRLIAMGVGPESRVGLHLERCADLLVGVLGILKAGGAYVPLDPAYPRERLAILLEDAGIEVLVTSERLLGRLPDRGARAVRVDAERDALAREPRTNPPVDVPPDGLAYVIFTSGSTGRPKGVMVEHRSVVNLSVALEEGVYGPALGARAHGRPALRVGMNAPLAFDASVKQWIQLLHGRSIHIVPEETRLDAEALVRFVRAQALDVIDGVPSQVRQLLDAGLADEPGAGPALVLVGGEALDERTWARMGAAPGTAFVNVYGPTECTVDATACRISAATAPSLGRPLANVQVYLLDEHLEPVPVGTPGEIVIGGAGVARGYLGQPSRTAERFVPDPFGGAGGRLYRTGDLARRLPDGSIEFLGRVDEQVKLRGFRIELAEIEAALRLHGAVRDAAVLLREDTPGEPRLVAYVVSRGSPPAPAELRRALLERLPEPMIPAAFVALDELPLTPNGKIDRRALPAPGAPQRGPEDALVAPRTPVEEVLAGIWADVLRLDRVGARDDFFWIGGHSLLATQVLARVRAAFRVDLPLRALFEAPTLAGLAERVEAARRAGAGAERPPLLPAGREGPLPLSFAQQRLWFLAQLAPDSAFYNVAGAVRIEGPLDRAALEESFQEIVRRHEALRTTFAAVDGVPRQVIAPPGAGARLPFEGVDLRALPGPDRDAAVRRLAAEEARRPFDLERGPLARATLLQLADAEHVLLLTMHHIVSDGWSVGVLLRELSALYDALRGEGSREGRPPLPALEVQYADFALWQRRWLTDEVLEAQLAHWRRQLGGADGAGSAGDPRGPVPALELPTDRPRPAAQTFRGAAQPVRLPADLSDRLRALCRREGVTPFMALLAAFQLLLHRYSGQTDFAVGSPVAGRTQPEIEGLIGFFVNTLVLRADLSGDPTFLELLARVREVTLAAHENQDVPFERLVDALRPERDLGRSPLFQVMLALQNAPAEPIAIPGLTLTPIEIDSGTAKFDLTLSLTDTEEGFQGTLEYNTDLFDARTAARVPGHLEALLEAVVQAPEQPVSRAPILTEAERREILVAWNDTAAPYPRDRRIHELFEEQARRAPDATAVILGEQALTYGELNRRANQLAHHLRKLGVGRETLVAVSAGQSLERVIAVLGVLKAGGAYVPLDPTYPGDRLRRMLDDTRAPVLLTQRALLPRFAEHPARAVCLDADREAIARESDEDPAVEGSARDLVYVIYTSGSTGKPKGVLVEHAALGNLLAQSGRLGAGPGRRVAQLLRFGFDPSALEIFMALTSGATLCLAPDDLLPGPEVTRWLREMEIDAVALVPSLLAALPVEPLPALRWVLVGGEPFPPGLVPLWAPGRRLFNGYGPTEATVVATLAACEEGSSRVPIGRPLANVQVYVLDPHRVPLPVGVPGELYIGGDGLARGYLNDPDLTAERFVPSPFAPGARLYRTGDRARWLPDGTLEYLDRVDHQVKLRGFRIELGEIEATLAEHPAVLDAAVVVREDVPGDRRLVAYWTAREAPAPGAGELRRHLAGELRRHLKERLPEYMVPSAFVALEAMPRTPVGKIDRRALPRPDAAPSGAGAAHAPPRTPTEEVIAGIWAETLGVPRVGARDSFFDLGGHSLLATQAISRLNASFGVALPLRALFEEPTVAGLAARVEAARRLDAERPAAPPLVPGPRGADAPLSFGQQRLWFLHRLEPESSFYNIPAAVRIHGALDAAALEQSLRAIAARHEVLRTTIVAEQGRARQVVAPAPELALPRVDLAALDEEEREQRVARCAADEAQRPFDLTTGPLWRAVLLRLGHEEHVLLLTMHHIVSDGWSVGVLLRELSALYEAHRRGAPSPLPELPVQYGDFAVWQRRWLDGEARELQLAYWKRQLAGAPPCLELPTDRPRPPIQRFRGATLSFQISGELTAALERLSRRAGATPFMTLLAVFQVLLGRHAGVEDVSVGTPVAGRLRPELEGLIGLFVNTLVLRTDLSGDPTFEQLLARVRDVALGAYEHQDVPFDQVVDALQPPRDLGRTPLFQVAFALQNAPLPSLSLDGLTLTPLLAESTTSKFDLSLTLAAADDGDGMQAWLQYNTDLFDGATAALLADHYRALLEGAAHDPAQPLSALTARVPSLAHGRVRQPTPAEIAAGPLEHVAPRTPLEQTLAQFWREVLNVERVGVHDDFFLLGGNSLLSMLVVHRIQEALDVEVPLQRLFEAPTLGALAAAVEAELAARGDGPDQARQAHAAGPPMTRAEGNRAQLLAQLDALSDAEVDALLRVAGAPGRPAAAPAAAAERRARLRGLLELDGPRVLPLSFGQQRLWFLDRLEPGSPFYNIPAAVRIRGALDAAALEQSLRAIAARHEALRTAIVAVRGQPHQVVAPAPELALPLVDLAALDEAEREQRVARCAADEAQRPFDLTTGPLWRAVLLRLGHEEHVLLLTMHHIVSDGWSVGVLLRELSALYEAHRRGAPSPLPELPVQYGDFAVWQRRWLEGEARELQLAYWRRQLAGAPPCLELPTDRPRPPIQRFRGATLTFQLPRAMAEGIEGLSRRLGVTPFMTLLAAFQVLLGHHAGVEDVSVGTPVAGRHRTELEGLIGLFVNTLVLRTDLSGDPTFEQLLARVRDVALGAYEHQDVPFDQVVDALQPPRDLGRTPLFQVAFALQNAPLPSLSLDGLTLSPLLAESTTSKFDLSLTLAAADDGDGMQAWLQYNTDLFDGATAALLADHYRALLEGAARDPARPLSALTARVPSLADGRVRQPTPAVAAPPAAATADDAPRDHVPPRTPLEQTLAQLWREVLNVERVGVHDDFFLLGGSSLLAMLVLHRLQEALDIEVPVHRLFEASTLGALAAAVEAELAARGDGDGPALERPAHPALVRLRAGEAHLRPLFLVHGAGGSVLNYADLVRHLDPARPVYGLHAPALDGDEALPATVEEMARGYLAELRAVQPGGPYLLGGWSFGGVVAFEMAQQLRAAGETVALLALIDSHAPTSLPAPAPDAPTSLPAPAPDALTSLAAFCSALGLRWQHLPWDLAHLSALDPRERLAHVLDRLRQAGELAIDVDQADRWRRVFERDLAALRGYTPRPYPGPAALLRAEVVPGDLALADDRGWSAWITAGLAAHATPGDHHTMLRPPHVAALAAALSRHLDDAEAQLHGEPRRADRPPRAQGAVAEDSAE
ncbi:non-ribosomal peptide synthase/polyketide synthase [Sorangium sp. So ce1024]|uniref:non-ribosomal peptide synthase/polyketide synthase n=1 Tax=Sorangium sp. So ce1024 TaxID=3133327 RepID=UPI003F06290C